MPMLSPADEGPVSEQILQYLHSQHGEHHLSLRIDLDEGRIVLRGCARTYYQKQIWLHGALRVAGEGGVVDYIEVA